MPQHEHVLLCMKDPPLGLTRSLRNGDISTGLPHLSGALAVPTEPEHILAGTQMLGYFELIIESDVGEPLPRTLALSQSVVIWDRCWIVAGRFKPMLAAARSRVHVNISRCWDHLPSRPDRLGALKHEGRLNRVVGSVSDHHARVACKRHRCLLEAFLSQIRICRAEPVLISAAMVCPDAPFGLDCGADLPRHTRVQWWQLGPHVSHLGILGGCVDPFASSHPWASTRPPTWIVHRSISRSPPWVPTGPVILREGNRITVDSAMERVVVGSVHAAATTVLVIRIGASLGSTIGLLAPDGGPHCEPEAGLCYVAHFCVVLAGARHVAMWLPVCTWGCLSTDPFWEERIDRIAWLGVNEA